MPTDQLIILAVGIVLEASLLAAIFVRRRYSVCLAFPLYVAAVLVPSLLFAAWPGRFYIWENYLLKEMVHNLLKCTIALELAFRTFRAFPGARAAGRMVLATVVALVAIVTLTAPLPERNPDDIDIEWHARMLNGTIWLFTGVAAVTLWYRLPLDAFQKAILVGFAPYLLVFSFGMRAAVEVGLENSSVMQYTHTLAYAVVLAYWNRVAWSRQPITAASAIERSRGRQAEPA